MSATSGGVEWSQLVKPLLAASYGSVNKQDIPEIVKAIIKSKEEILHHEDQYESFYASFCILAADYLASNSHQVTIGGLTQAVSASKVLIQYMINHIGSAPIVVVIPASGSSNSTPSKSTPVSSTAKNTEADTTNTTTTGTTTNTNSVSFTNGEKDKERQVTIHDKYLLSGLKALCRGSGALHRPDKVALVSAMKVAKLPTHIKTSSPGDRESGIKDGRRNRSDPSAAILEQLISPLHDLGGSRLRPPQPATPPVAADREAEANNGEVSDSGVDMRNLFGSRCVSALQFLGGGELLIDVCLKLPTIQKYTQRYKDLLEGKGHGFPTTMSEALSIKSGLNQMVQELNTAWRIISLPLLEPLSATRLQKLSTIAMAVLLASLTVATSVAIITVATQGTSSSKTPPPPREDDLDIAAPSITEKALDLFNVVLNAVRSSTRAGGHHIQNLQLMGAWLLMTGLHQLMILLSSVVISSNIDKKEEKGRSPSKKDGSSSRINLAKVQQGFGVVCVALASQGITLLTGLLEDVKVEGWAPTCPPEPARLDPLDTFTATERLARIFISVPLNQLLFYMAAVAYRKACCLKRTQRAMHEGDTFSISDSTTYYDDDFSEESLGEEDDDSVIIGSWFEEPATPGEDGANGGQGGSSSSSSSSSSSHANSQTKTPHRQNSEVTTLVPEKGEPHGFISLASHIFLLMNNCLVESECAYVQQYVRGGLSETLMMVFATIIRDLDKETSKSYSGSLTTYLGPVLGLLYDEFSFALYRYTHNVIASGLLTESLQNTLLMQLNVSPWIHEGDWPLQVLPRTLSILAQILLLRQRKEKDELKCDSDPACVLIWQRVINTLVMSIMKTGNAESEIEDLNVEHAQLLLFLFHSLQLMQKKNVLLSVASAIVNVAPVVKTPLRDSQVLHLSRLLLIFDYLVKNLYEAPQALIDQVQWNLFKPITSSGETPPQQQQQQQQPQPQQPPQQSQQQHKEQTNSNASGKLYHMWQQLEENYHKHCSSDDTTIRPCFYTLTPAETNTQDAPKLDGLACSFILATPDSLKYSSLYETLVSLLSIGCQLDPNIRSVSDPNLSFLGLCSVQYAFSLAYRTLLTMPPSVSALESMANQEVSLEGPTILHSLLWGPRAAHKVFNGWIKDGLVRQSLTTQKADSLLKSVANSLCCLQHDMKMAGHIITALVNKLSTNDITPSFSELFILDAVLSRLQVTLDEACQKGEIDLRSSEGLDLFQALKLNPDQVPVTGLLQLIQILAKTTRSSLLEQMNTLLEEGSKMSQDALEAYSSVLAIAGDKVSFIQPCLLRENLLAPLKTALDSWNANTMKEFPPVTSAWKSNFSNDILPGETYVSSIVMGHISSLSHQPSFSINVSLKHVMHTLVTFTTELAGWYTESDKNHNHLTSTLVALAVDATCDHVSSAVTTALKRLLPYEGGSKGDKKLITCHLYSHLLTYVEKLLQVATTHPRILDDQIINGCGSFLERILDSNMGKKALESFLSSSTVAAALLSPCPTYKSTTAESSEGTEETSMSYTLPSPIIKFLVKLFLSAEKSIKDPSLSIICSHINLSSWIENGSLQQWLMTSCLQSTPPSSDSEDLPDGWLLLRTLASYAVTLQNHENGDISHRLLLALVPLGSSMVVECPQGMGNLPHLLSVMSSLISASSGEGHLVLFRATALWVLKCKGQLSGEHDQLILNTMCHLLSYISDVMCSLKILNDRSIGTHHSGVSSPHLDNEVGGDTDSDWVDELAQDDDESGDEDSDDENMSNRLCTFTLTQKEFMNQHWYHCHTCRMIDGVGVCTVCAKVCHRGHDVTYAKYGSFFCDCGAKEDGTCQALVKRSAASYSEGVSGPSAGPSSAFGVEPLLPSSLRRRTSSPTSQDKNQDDTFKHRQSLAKALENVRDQMISEVNKSDIGTTVLQLLSELMPTIQTVALQSSAIGTYQRTLSALHQIHAKPKVVDQSDNLMVATLGSQEGAFENVRLNYSGEQGQTIRQLVSSHMIHRVAMCILASPGGKRQHLAVSHEKGKITVLQLSSLLKQHDSAKKKLTLTRLSSAPVPFTVLSITSNPINDDFLAVCGVKDCHILTFSTSGSVSDHLVLHPHLESGNYIIKAIWLPGQQTQLALVCADFVKIYDLSTDSLSPQYFFQMPSGKIKDACLMVSSDDSYHLIVMASSGYIYTQVLCEQSSAKHGPFFVTNVLSISHPDLKDVNGDVGGGGVSIYYSHTLQLLGFSYSQGKSFLAPLTSLGENDKIEKLFAINMKGSATSSSTAVAGGSSSNSSSRNSSDGSNGSTVGSGAGTSGGNSKHSPQPLCQWGEVPGHPGIITCVAQNGSWDGNTKGNSPVILMVKPDSIQVQELKVVPSKSKMTDLVALRHSWSVGHEARTTLILLCEDGSLKIFNANPSLTDFWLSPQMQKESIMASLKPARKKKVPKLGRTSGSVMFPVDFFEHCSIMNSIEFGGNDLLQIYNVQQLKNRLNGQAMYVASTKPGGFSLEVTNNDPTLVICAVRVSVGSVEISKIPSYVEIFGRSITLSANRSRWFDIPLTREESLQADKLLTLVFGPSTDPSGVTILDSVKIYGKTKDDFGWPEEAEEYSTSGGSSGGVIAPGDIPLSVGSTTTGSSLILPLTATDRLVSAALETLDGTFCITPAEKNSSLAEAIDLATRLLNLPLPSSVQHHTRTLLASLHPTKTTYHNHKDSAQLATVVEGLTQLRGCLDPKQMDCEAFHRLVVIARNVAVARPQNLVRFTNMEKITTDSFEDKKNDSQETITQDSPEKPSESPKSAKLKIDKIADLTLDSDKTIQSDILNENEPSFLSQLMSIFWALHKARPSNGCLTPVCQPGLTYVEATINALIEIIHAFTVTSLQAVPYAVKLYSELLLCSDTCVSFSAKQAIIKVLRPRNKRRRVFIPSPPRCLTPGAEDAEKDISSTDAGLVVDIPFEGAEGPDPLAEASGGDELDEELRALGARVGVNESAGEMVGGDLGGGLMGGIMDLHGDDDDAMVELAIALSLHDGEEQGSAQDLGPLHPGLEGLVGGLPGLHQLQGLSGQVLHSLLAAGGLQGAGNQNNEEEVSQMNLTRNAADEGDDADGERDAAEETHDNEHFSDTTVSANGSDDDDGEGSTAATDGGSNLMRASPAEQPGSGGSESGGSVGESLGGEHNVSGRSSMYGDPSQETGGLPLLREGVVVTSTATNLQETAEDVPEEGVALHTLRISLLDSLIMKIPSLKSVGGVISIPFFQVILMLTSDLDGNDSKDKVTVESLLKSLVIQMDMNDWDLTTVWERTPDKEVQLVILRLLGVMMSRSKSGSRPSSDASVIPTITANTLMKCGALDHCLSLLKALLEYWRNLSKEQQSGTVIGGGLLKRRPSAPAPDMSPFFLRQYVKGNAQDIFAAFPHLLTEMLLRLPYQIKKLGEGSQLESSWSHYLCEYTMTQQTPVVRRQVRKLLLFICGHKDSYRQMRDMHALDYHMKEVKVLCGEGGFSFSAGSSVSPIILPYDSLIHLVEHLKGCVEIATSRTSNWQKYCLKDESILGFLMEVSCLLEEGVAPTVLQLLQAALCPKNSTTDVSKKEVKSSNKQRRKQASSSSSVPGRSSSAKRASSEDSEVEAKGEESHCSALVSQINRYLDRNHLSIFLHTFLLESNSSNVRWQAHGLILAIYKHSSPKDQESLLTLMWSLWPCLPTYGRKAAQFVDLLGYFSLKTRHCEKKVLEYIDKAVQVLGSQSQILAHHPNASLYNSLSSLVEFDGYYLESEPCLVCNNPEVPFVSVKLSTVKVDSRFTTKTQLVKLVGSHMISRLTLRITDLKRSKMVRTLNIYYNNRSVQAVVELKNKPSMWNKAKKVTLSAGQTEVKMDFPLPIVACNLMFEYADFYENLQASTETLLCPRCSAAVPASPGVCANCGENVYQCHKCRAINYDEKDPFLCNSCGYCKYAKFDYTLHCRPCCAVDPIESEEDRKKAVFNIDLLLEKADRSYKQLQSYKPNLELLLVRISEQGVDRGDENTSGTNHVNRAIQQLAQKYCGDCKNAFDELSKIIQRVQASRRELVAYDRAQKEGGKKTLASPFALSAMNASLSSEEGRSSSLHGRCYGCAAAATEHCITLLRALAINPNLRSGLCKQGLIQDLLEYNLRRGTVQVRNEVRQLLCLLTKDDLNATLELNELIIERLSTALNSHITSPDLALAVRHEMALLAASAKQEDSCWEHRLRCVVQIFLMAGGSNASPMVMEFITLPCLRILQGIMKPPTPPPPRKVRDKTSTSTLAASATVVLNANTNQSVGAGATNIMESYNSRSKVGVDMHKWLAGDPNHTYESWKKRSCHTLREAKIAKMNKQETRDHYLMEKYGCLWLSKTLRHQYELKLMERSWVRRVLFNPSSRMARHVTAQMLEFLCTSTLRKKEILDMLTTFLSEIGESGESSTEFVSLFQTMIINVEWKHYLALKGILPNIASLIMDEINHITILEETSLNTDLSQGYALKILTELLSLFVEVDAIKRIYKGRLLGTVLSGYLSLRKLVIQRTKLIDDTQKKLLELLEDMTSGTEEETKEFMGVCVATVKQYPPDDLRTPVFIFERLCSIIYPEENDVGEFFLTLEKDPQQEDFLQGRMVGNPYSSLDPGLGPLMRDVKNKICQDCELVALLEDDNGMELLVCNKIISLDLPVKEVYKKVWLPENSDCEAMRVIYRMRGLLGDATEEFVETLDKKKEENVDNEQVYRMATVMSQCHGLEVMLECLQRITDLSHAKPLVTVLMKLFQFCVKIRSNRERLTDPSLGAIGVLLHTLKQCLAAEPEVVAGAPGGPSLTEQILMVLEATLMEASSMSADRYAELVETCGTLEDIHLLLNYVATSSRTNSQVRQLLMRVLPFLVFCHKEKMELLVGHFRPVLDFEKFDSSHSAEDQAKMEAFCVFCYGIERNHIGNQLKDMIIRANIVRDALAYLEKHTPKSKKLVVICDDEWKEYISKPSLKYILRLLTGLAWKHPGTQLAVSQCIPAIHSLEQISSDEHVGSLAENLLEALRDDPVIAKKVQETRQLTRQEKKQLAMKTRKKELEKLGLRANEKEQITSESSLLQQMEDITEESGLVCAICLEGYRCQPQKVLAIYTFSKRCILEEYEGKSHKTLGYCTVSHFNVVHVDCHLAAVRATRSRDEWDSAALHNANTKANGLLPLWGPQVPESAFASCLARHNTYLQESTTHRDIGYVSTIQDLKLLLLRFASEKSFSDDSGGGGPQSNMNLIPYVLHMALYVLNTTRSFSREEKRVDSFLEGGRETWVESSFEAEGPFFIGVLALAVLPYNRWKEKKLTVLKRLIVANHVRVVCGHFPAGGKVHDKSIQDWSTYKNAAIFWSLLDNLYKRSFKNVSLDGDWSVSLAEFIRHNDQVLLEASAKILSTYQEDLVPVSSFEEFCDVAELLSDIENPGQFLSDLLQSLP